LNVTAEYIIHFSPVIVKREHMRFLAGTKERVIQIVHVWHSKDGRTYKIIHSGNEQEDVAVNNEIE